MAFTISPLLYDDIPAFALADELANADWPFARAQEVPGIPRRIFVEEWTKKEWGKDPTLHWMKAANAETGEFAAAALWKFPDPPSHPHGGQGSSKADQENDEGNVDGAAVETAAANPGVAEGPDQVERAKQAAGNAEMMTTMRQQWDAFAEQHIGDQPFASKQTHKAKHLRSIQLIISKHL